MKLKNIKHNSAIKHFDLLLICSPFVAILLANYTQLIRRIAEKQVSFILFLFISIISARKFIQISYHYSIISYIMLVVNTYQCY